MVTAFDDDLPAMAAVVAAFETRGCVQTMRPKFDRTSTAPVEMASVSMSRSLLVLFMMLSKSCGRSKRRNQKSGCPE